MSANMESNFWLQDRTLRTVGWGGAVCLFVLPVVARLAVDLPWTGGDFLACQLRRGKLQSMLACPKMYVAPL